MVFDAAARFNGASLNDQLYQGPDLANSLIGVLIRFREEEIALTADLEAMLHQVKVLEMLVHIFGTTSSPCCANKAMHQTADDNEDQFDPEVTLTVCRNFYFDDVLKSVPNEGRAIWLAQQLIELMKKGGFHLTKFSSNSRKFLAMLPEKERANPELNLDLDDLLIGRVLGLHWDANSNTFQFKVIPTSKLPTKRGILSTVSSLRSTWIFEPIHSSHESSFPGALENGSPVG